MEDFVATYYHIENEDYESISFQALPQDQFIEYRFSK